VVRAPYLARVELAYRRLALGLGDARGVAEAALAYFRRFRHKPMTHLDLQWYVRACDCDAQTWLADALNDVLDQVSSSAVRGGGSEIAGDAHAGSRPLRES